jgi:hypothetical protein
LGFWGAAKHPKMGSHRAIGFPTENSEFWGSGGTLRVDHVPNGKPLLSHTVIFVYRVVWGLIIWWDSFFSCIILNQLGGGSP